MNFWSTCQKTDKIYAYQQGQLNKRQMAQVEAHLSKCEKCSADLAAMIKAELRPATADEQAFLASMPRMSVEARVEQIQRDLLGNGQKTTSSSRISEWFGQKPIRKPAFGLVVASVLVVTIFLGKDYLERVRIGGHQDNVYQYVSASIHQTDGFKARFSNHGPPLKLLSSADESSLPNEDPTSSIDELSRLVNDAEQSVASLQLLLQYYTIKQDRALGKPIACLKRDLA